jgi:hypothetical protein
MENVRPNQAHPMIGKNLSPNRPGVVHLIVLSVGLAACVDLTPPWSGHEDAGRGDASAEQAGGGEAMEVGQVDSVAMDQALPTDGGDVAQGQDGQDGQYGDDANPDTATNTKTRTNTTTSTSTVTNTSWDANAEQTGAAEVMEVGQVDSGATDQAMPADGRDTALGQDSGDASPDVATNTNTSTATNTNTNTRTNTATNTSTNTATSTGTSTTTGTSTHTATVTSTVTQTLCNSGSYDAKTLSHSDGIAESDGWFLSGASNFLYADNIITFEAVPTKVTVVARGDYVSGAWPHMSVSMEGQSNIIGTASITSTTMTPYSFTFVPKAMISGFGVTVTSGNGLHVQSVTLSCP